MAAGTLRADRPEDRGADPEPVSTGFTTPDGDSLESLLGRTSAQLDRAVADLALATRLRERMQQEIDRLERRLRDAEAECAELRDKVDHRDRLLSLIFGSRSWRWAQAMRRAVGRS